MQNGHVRDLLWKMKNEIDVFILILLLLMLTDDFSLE
jgi:hypothetical protein